MDKDTRPGDRQDWIITDPALAQRMEGYRRERKARRRRRTAARITALVAAFLLGLAVGRYTRTPVQAGPTLAPTPAPTVKAIDPTDALPMNSASELWSDDRIRIDTPLLTADLEAETQWAIFELCGQDTNLFCATMAIAYSESRFTADLLGDNGKSVGMMQINTDYHQDRMEALGVTDLTDPVQCAAVAIDYLKELENLTGATPDDPALYMAYNMGPSGARKAIAAGRETTPYSEAVLATYRSYKEEMEWAADD